MKSNETELKFLYLAIDLVILNIAVAIVFYYSSIPWMIAINAESLSALLLNLSAVITYTVFSSRNLYLHDNFANRVKRITNRLMILIIFVLVLAQILLPKGYSVLFFLESAIVFYFGKLIFYFILYKYLQIRRKNGFYVHRVLIIGVNEMSVFLKQLLDNNPMLGYVFVGYVSPENSDKEDVVGTMDDLGDLVEKNGVDMLLVTLAEYNDLKKMKELLAICNRIGVRLRFVPENQYWFKPSMKMESVGSLVVFNPQEIPLDENKSRVLKRLFDIVFSSLVIVFVISWLFPLLAAIIKLSSKGPVFFCQKRTGINNKTFSCLKFRSMTMSNDADIKQATKDDVRITPIGKFMRKTNLDEFPQFFNVLLGQMSIVGPRPHMLKHTELYSELIEYYKIRHYVKPGITGWAQVNGYRGETDELWKMEKRVEYDMYYLENWNFLWDLKIVFLTVFGKGVKMNAF